MSDESNNWPKTVDEAVDMLIKDLSTNNRELLEEIASNGVYGQHFGLGMYIRGAFGLLSDNNALIMSCQDADGGRDSNYVYMDPDGASGVILDKLYERLSGKVLEKV